MDGGDIGYNQYPLSKTILFLRFFIMQSYFFGFIVLTDVLHINVFFNVEYSISYNLLTEIL